ncbi:unnamed protein product [Tetraodon nigroviridis]|uniref:(spotted green pufferfish) hypothetical protein n=1 Tax=Tetraodon nigroviridis TaxID=99883 RepID=Q4SLW1_TETNG|nr:unnamed protein product [Tetraodon nigroviridis]
MLQRPFTASSETVSRESGVRRRRMMTADHTHTHTHCGHTAGPSGQASRPHHFPSLGGMTEAEKRESSRKRKAVFHGLLSRCACQSVDQKPPSSKSLLDGESGLRRGELHQSSLCSLAKRDEAAGRGEGVCRYAALAVEPLSHQSGAQMANNYSSTCAWLLASHQLFRRLV